MVLPKESPSGRRRVPSYITRRASMPGTPLTNMNLRDGITRGYTLGGGSVPFTTESTSAT